MIVTTGEHERIVQRLRSRIGAVLGLRLAVAALSGWLLLWGTAVLVLRMMLRVPTEELLWGLAGVAAAVAIGVTVAVRRRPSAAEVRAIVDGRGRCGGLLMTAGAMEIGNWSGTLPPAVAPRVRWHGGRSWAVLLSSTAFVVASFLMPARYLAAVGSQKLEIGTEVDRIAEKVQMLAEEKILPPQQAESLEQALSRLQQEAEGHDPAKAWEAMDHVEQSLAKSVAEAAETAGRSAQLAARSQELAKALEKAHDQMDEQERSRAMKILSRRVQQAAAEDAQLKRDLSDELKKSCESGSLRPEQLDELARDLEQCQSADLNKLKKMLDAKMIDASTLKECQGQCKSDAEALANLLAQCKADQAGKAGTEGKGESLSATDALTLWESRLDSPGRGGVSRGPGAAAMTWSDRKSREDVKFKERVLPAGAVISMKESRLQGVSVGDPQSGPAGSDAAGGALGSAGAGHGSAQTQVILPEHRGVIQRYFQRSAAEGKPAPESKAAP